MDVATELDVEPIRQSCIEEARNIVAEISLQLVVAHAHDDVGSVCSATGCEGSLLTVRLTGRKNGSGSPPDSALQSDTPAEVPGQPTAPSPLGSVDQPVHGQVDPYGLLGQLPAAGLTVSTAAFQLVQHAYSIMSRAAAMAASEHPANDDDDAPANRTEAVLLVATARDCLEMYLAVIPMRQQLGSWLTGEGAVHRYHALYHNDCWFLARHAGVLAVWAREVAEGLSTTTLPLLIDLVHPFTTAAQSSYVTMVRDTRDRVLAAWDGAPTLESAADEEGEQRLRAAVTAQLDIIRTVSSLWSPILPVVHYRRAVGFVLDAVLERTCGGVLVLDNMTDTTGTALAGIIRHQAQGAVYLQPGSSSVDAAVASEYIRHWARADQLADVLAASPAQIKAWVVPGGVIDTVGGLSRRDVAKLVRALFDAGPDRTRLLNAIQEHQGKVPPQFV